jgi:hypothetical protein
MRKFVQAVCIVSIGLALIVAVERATAASIDTAQMMTGAALALFVVMAILYTLSVLEA